MDVNILVYKRGIEVVGMNTTISSALTNITAPTDLIYNINDASSGIFGITILFTIYIILFITLLNQSGDLKLSFNASTYVSMILAWMLWILDLIATNWLYIFLILTMLGVASLFIRRDT